MPRLIGILDGKIANIAFDVDVLSERSSLDSLLKMNFAGAHDSTALINDQTLRAEIGDGWDGTQGVEPFVQRHVRSLEAINAKTRAVISLGYEWPSGSGKRFSLSDTAQRNLAELDKLRDSLLTYPFLISTLDDSYVYPVPDAATLHNMYLTALSIVQNAYGIGNVLKSALTMAKTNADIDAIIDLR